MGKPCAVDAAWGELLERAEAERGVLESHSEKTVGETQGGRAGRSTEKSRETLNETARSEDVYNPTLFL